MIYIENQVNTATSYSLERVWGRRGIGKEKILRTCLRSFVGVVHIPGSQNTAQGSVKMKTVNNNRNAICMAGLLEMSDDFQG